jgi:hypothetical protein
LLLPLIFFFKYFLTGSSEPRSLFLARLKGLISLDSLESRVLCWPQGVWKSYRMAGFCVSLSSPLVHRQFHLLAQRCVLVLIASSIATGETVTQVTLLGVTGVFCEQRRKS